MGGFTSIMQCTNAAAAYSRAHCEYSQHRCSGPTQQPSTHRRALSLAAPMQHGATKYLQAPSEYPPNRWSARTKEPRTHRRTPSTHRTDVPSRSSHLPTTVVFIAVIPCILEAKLSSHGSILSPIMQCTNAAATHSRAHCESQVHTLSAHRTDAVHSGATYSQAYSEYSQQREVYPNQNSLSPCAAPLPPAAG
jgi:hypothetical protein